MKASTLQLTDSALLLQRQIPHYKAKITRDNNGRVQGYVKRDGSHCYQPIALKGLPDYLTEEAMERTIKLLESSYVKLQGHHLDVMLRGLGGIPPGKDVPEYFICPISKEIMKTPIVTLCGHTFEKMQLLQRMNSQHTTCPICQKSLKLDQNPNNWRINYAIKSQIDEWQRQKIEPVYPRALCENPAALDPTESNLFFQLAKYSAKQGDNSEAIKQYEEAIKSTENSEIYVAYIQLLLKANYPLKASKAFIYLARWYKKENNHQEVVKAYREATQLQPNNKDFLEEFARYLETVGEKEEAIHCYETLVALTKKEENPFSTLAKYYKKLIELKPNELEYYEAFKRLLKTNDQREEAKEIKNKILEIQKITWSDPEKVILKKELAKLKRRNAELKKNFSQLQAFEKNLEMEMKRTFERLCEEIKKQEFTHF